MQTVTELAVKTFAEIVIIKKLDINILKADKFKDINININMLNSRNYY